MGRVYKRQSISRFSFYARASPRHAGSTLGTHGQARQSGNPFHGSASLQVSPPHDTPPQLCAHGLTTSNRRTSSRAVYRVFWHTYELIGLGGPARLYQAIGHIGARPFYETPRAILLKADSFGHAKRLRGAVMYRSLRGLRKRPWAVLFLACIPDELRGAPGGILHVYHTGHPTPGGDTGQPAPGGDTPRYFTLAYQTHCPGW